MSIGKDVSRRLSAALPPPHEGEPASLRQDILDELADHLACAYRRELLRTHGDTELTRRNVRERFGDPARLARTLWFDAMRGRLMAQKLMLAMTGVCVLVAGAIAYLGWRQLEASQEVNRELISSQQEANAALLERLEGLSIQPDGNSDQSLEWSSMELAFVEEGSGRPVRDLKVSVNGPYQSTDHNQMLADLRPDEEGVVRIDHAYIGGYNILIEHPLGYTVNEEISVQPGVGRKKTYVVPKDFQVHQYQLQVNWPERLHQRDVWAIVSVRQSGEYRVNGTRWQLGAPKLQRPELFIAVSSKGDCISLGLELRDMSKVREYIPGFDTVGNSLDSHFEYAKNALPNLPYGQTHARKLEPTILGLFPDANLPMNWDMIKAKSLWVSISTNRGSDEIRSVPSIYVSREPIQTVSSSSEIVKSSYVFQYGNADVLELAPMENNILQVNIPEVVANSIPEDQLPPISPVEARRPSFRVPVTIRCIEEIRDGRELLTEEA